MATLVEQVKGPPITAGEAVTWEARLKIPTGIPPSQLGNVLNYPVVINVCYVLHVSWFYFACTYQITTHSIPQHYQMGIYPFEFKIGSTEPEKLPRGAYMH